MRTSTILYVLTGLAATNVIAQRVHRVDPVLGEIFCSKEGVPDPTETCSKLGMNSFCVSLELWLQKGKIENVGDLIDIILGHQFPG